MVRICAHLEPADRGVESENAEPIEDLGLDGTGKAYKMNMDEWLLLWFMSDAESGIILSLMYHHMWAETNLWALNYRYYLITRVFIFVFQGVRLTHIWQNLPKNRLKLSFGTLWVVILECFWLHSAPSWPPRMRTGTRKSDLLNLYILKKIKNEIQS